MLLLVHIRLSQVGFTTHGYKSILTCDTYSKYYYVETCITFSVQNISDVSYTRTLKKHQKLFGKIFEVSCIVFQKVGETSDFELRKY